MHAACDPKHYTEQALAVHNSGQMRWHGGARGTYAHAQQAATKTRSAGITAHPQMLLLRSRRFMPTVGCHQQSSCVATCCRNVATSPPAQGLRCRISHMYRQQKTPQLYPSPAAASCHCGCTLGASSSCCQAAAPVAMLSRSGLQPSTADWMLRMLAFWNALSVRCAMLMGSRKYLQARISKQQEATDQDGVGGVGSRRKDVRVCTCRAHTTEQMLWLGPVLLPCDDLCC